MLKERLKALGLTQRKLKEYINSKGEKISKNTITAYIRNPNIGLPRTERVIEEALKEWEDKYHG